MVSWLAGGCGILGAIAVCLMWKVVSLRRAAQELRREFRARLLEDTNVGITVSTRDREMLLLAADMDRQLKLLRREHIRYTRGDRELRNAINSISHDLRTPLTAIWGYLELLEREQLTPNAERYLKIIENRAQTMKELTEELFRYSVILSADTYEEKENLSLNAVLEESLAGFYGAFTEAGIEPQIIMPHKVVTRLLSRQALSRIFSNIISNAIKYSDGDFRVSLEENGEIWFCNHAAGLDRVQVGHLFDRFFTVENGSRSTGLGLAIAKTLVETQKGHIEAQYQERELKILVVFPEN